MNMKADSDSVTSHLTPGDSLLELLKKNKAKSKIRASVRTAIKNYISHLTKVKLIDIIVQVLGLEDDEGTKSDDGMDVSTPEAVLPLTTKKKAQKPKMKGGCKRSHTTEKKSDISQEKEKLTAKPLKKRPCLDTSSVKSNVIISSNDAPNNEVSFKIKDQAPKSNKFECQTCELSFPSRAVYRKHIQTHSVSIKCSICDKVFKSKDSLYHHQRGLHGKEKPYHCNVCDSYFSFHHSYKLHLQRHKGERPFLCGLCPKTYLTSNHLKEHMQAVHMDSSIICHICGKKFSYNSALKLHLQTHVDNMKYNCPTCSKEFNTKRALMRHSVHHLEHKCNVCGKYFKSDHYLNIHIKVHSNKFDKNYCCDICGKSFFYQCTLDSHIQTHSKSRSFVCSICDKKFKSKASLYTHKYVHNEGLAYPCTICSKSFKTKSCLSAHIKRHQSQCTYTCPICGKVFPDKGGLSKHTKTVHLPQRYYLCTICERFGTRADNMRTHVKSHRGQVGPGDDPMNFIVRVEGNKTRTEPLHDEKEKSNCDVKRTSKESSSLLGENVILSKLGEMCVDSILYDGSAPVRNSNSGLLMPSTAVQSPSNIMTHKETNFTTVNSNVGSDTLGTQNDEFRYNNNLHLSTEESCFNGNVISNYTFYPTGLPKDNSVSYTTLQNAEISDGLQIQSTANSNYSQISPSSCGQYIPVGTVHFTECAQTKSVNNDEEIWSTVSASSNITDMPNSIK